MKKFDIDPNELANLTRRAMLGSSMGLGTIAAAELLGGGKSLAKASGAVGGDSGPETVWGEYVTDADQKARIGQVADYSDAAEYQDLLAREQELAVGHADMRFAGLVAVTAPDKDALDAAVEVRKPTLFGELTAPANQDWIDAGKGKKHDEGKTT